MVGLSLQTNSKTVRAAYPELTQSTVKHEGDVRSLVLEYLVFHTPRTWLPQKEGHIMTCISR